MLLEMTGRHVAYTKQWFENLQNSII